MDAAWTSCPYCQSINVRVVDSGPVSYVSCGDCNARGPDLRQGVLQVELGGDESLLRTVIDESPDIILLKDWEGRFLLCNRALARLYGTSPEQMIGKSDADFNPDREQVDFYLKNVQQIMSGTETVIVEEQSTDVETGEVRYYQSIKKPLRGPDGRRRILVIAHDVTELLRARQALEEKQRRYSYAMEAAGEGIWDWDIVSGQVRHNPKWCTLLGIDDTRYEHDMTALTELLHPDDRADVFACIEQALATDGQYRHEHRMLRRDGEVLWVLDRGRVVERDDKGQPTRMVGSFTDITERRLADRKLAQASSALTDTNQRLERLVAKRTAELRRANAELEKLAHQDVLTGVSNRLSLNKWIEEAESSSESAGEVSVIMADVDYFKHINDNYGHSTGDRVLRNVAQCLRSHLRVTDVLARFGGEEFLAILPDVGLHEAGVIAEKLRQQIAALQPLPLCAEVTASFGVAEVSENAYMAAIERADKALYQAKRQGRNCVVSTP